MIKLVSSFKNCGLRTDLESMIYFCDNGSGVTVTMGDSEEDWYLSTLNNGAPIGCAHSILGVSDQVSPHEAIIIKGFRFKKKLCFCLLLRAQLFSELNTLCYGFIWI